MTGVLAVSAVAAFAGSVILVAATRRWALRRMILAHPSERGMHVLPTPRGGGLGIVVPVVVALMLAALREGDSGLVWLAVTSVVVALAGLYDDVRTLSPRVRLLIQAIAATLAATQAGAWRSFAWPGVVTLDLSVISLPLTVLLLVGLTNAFNFMDGIDGLAGTQGLVAGAGWIGIGTALGQPWLAATGGVLAAASLGFLLYNWAPASIFMGDVGACFVGFVLAALAVQASAGVPLAATAGLLTVWPLLFDTGLTLVVRARKRENLLAPHRTHLYQRLVLTGWSHREVALLYGALSAAGALAGIMALQGAVTGSGAVVTLACIPALASGLWLVVVWRERRPGARTVPASS